MVSQYVVNKRTIHLFKSVCSKEIFESFDDNKIALALADERNAIGIIIADIEGDKLMIEWLYVKKEFREHLLGSRLIMSILEAASRAGVRSVCAVSQSILMSSFLIANYFQKTDNHRGYVESSIGEFNELPSVDDELKSKVTPIDSILQKDINSLCNDLINKPDVSIGVKLPIKANEYSDLSMAFVKENTIYAIVLLKEVGNKLELSYVYMKPNMIKPLLAVLNVVLSRIKERYSDDTPIIFGILNEQSDNLARKLFRNLQFNSLYEFVRHIR